MTKFQTFFREIFFVVFQGVYRWPCFFVKIINYICILYMYCFDCNQKKYIEEEKWWKKLLYSGFVLASD